MSQDEKKKQTRRDFLKSLAFASTLAGPGKFIFRAGAVSGYFFSEEAMAQYAPFGFIKKKVTAAGSPGAEVYTAGSLWGWGSGINRQLGHGSISSVSSPIQIGADVTWVDLSGGDGYTMGIRANGSLWGWGTNANGRLGSNNTTTYSVPTQIGSSTDWSRIMTGNDNTVALKTNGTLWSWGANDTGQLGHGDTTVRSSPVQIGSDTNWAQVATGMGSSTQHSHLLAVKTDGSLYAWGPHTYFQLGTPTNVPLQNGPSSWSMVSASLGCSMGIRTDGSLWAWGSNGQGQLGLGTTSTVAVPTRVGALNDWAWVRVGVTSYGHTAAVKTNGTLWTWGSNSTGQLGSGNLTSRSSPAQVGTDTDWSKAWVHADYYGGYTIALKTNGTLWSWGASTYGVLGSADRTPNRIGTDTWIDIASGDDHSLGIKTGGTLWSWGKASQGALGLGSVSSSTVYSPSQVGALTNWASVAAGGDRSFGRRSDGALFAWGYSYIGGLGIGASTEVSSPVQVGSLTNWARIFAVGDHTLAIKTDGTLWAWGEAASGVLGNGNSTTNRSSPIQVGALTNWSRVSGSDSHSIAVKTDGTLWGWGQGNRYGGTSSSSPVQIGAAISWAEISSRKYHNLALRSDGTLWSWGSSNSDGQMGFGNTTSQSLPTQVGSATNWSSICASEGSSYAIKSDGTLWSWGSARYAMLGDTVTTARSSPVAIADVGPWSKLTAGQKNVLGLKTDGSLYSWGVAGSGENGRLATTPVQRGSATWKTIAPGSSYSIGIRTDDTVWEWGSVSVTGSLEPQLDPVQVGSATYTDITASRSNTATLSIRSNGTLWAWGNNTDGNLGNGTVNYLSSPIQIGSHTTWVKAVISDQGNYAAGIKSDGTLWTWGNNYAGNLGVGDTTYRSSPVLVGSGFADVSVGGAYSNGGGHVLALKTDGTLWVWGDVVTGALGLTFYSPTRVGVLNDWVSVAAGNYFSLAIKSDGTLWSWGDYSNGKLGYAATANQPIPKKIGTATNWSRVYAGSNSAFAIKTDGTLWAWGANSNGQLGDGTTTTRSSPVQIGTYTGWRMVAAIRATNSEVTIAIRTDGTIWCWGSGTNVQGIPSPAARSSPVQIGTGTNWSRVVVGGNHAMGTRS